MQDTSQPMEASSFRNDDVDHHLSNYRGRWFLNYRFLGREDEGRAFTKVHLGTYDLATARDRRNSFIDQLRFESAPRKELVA